MLREERCTGAKMETFAGVWGKKEMFCQFVNFFHVREWSEGFRGLTNITILAMLGSSTVV